MTGRGIFSLCALSAVLLMPAATFACACGCNMFTVGTRWMMPTSAGLGAYLQYNYMNQSRNWSNWQSAPAEANEDQEIRTSFYTLGIQYMADRDWGFTIEAPVWNRYFRTIDDDGNAASVTHTSFGDVRLTGMYTGLSEDMSTGLQFGVKLPTGPYNESLLDRDTQIGTGTTDLLLGGYQMGQEKGWGWYTQAKWQHAFNEREGYRPGDSFDVNVGAHYDGLLESLMIVPVLQIQGSFRAIDSGENADPENTGYSRLYVTPGFQVVASNHFTLYADLRIPVLTHVRGNQLVAPAPVNLAMGYNF
ncbi:MAG TPA: hypothetical protein VK569_06450 [Bacteroidota bacterium]|nr:hypothetical protein [Bacteroidota bacterium]